MSFPSTAQLKRALKIRAKIESLEQKLDRIIGSTQQRFRPQTAQRKMSASARARIAKAQRARWAKLKVKSVAKAGPEGQAAKNARSGESQAGSHCAGKVGQSESVGQEEALSEAAGAKGDS